MRNRSSPKLSVRPTDQSFAYWASRPYVPAKLRARVEQADVVVTPMEGFRGKPGPLFPGGTREVMQHLADGNPALKIEIASGDDEYQEFSLHGALIILGGFLITSIVAPIVADLLAEYIKRRCVRPEDDDVSIELTVVRDDGSASKLSYEGPAAAFREHVLPAIRENAEASGPSQPRYSLDRHDR